MFDSPILKFDDYWTHDDKEIYGCKVEYVSRWAPNLSSYEKTLLAIWIQQFSSSICQDVFDYKELQLWGPVSEKISLMTEIIDRYPYIFYGKEKLEKIVGFKSLI